MSKESTEDFKSSFRKRYNEAEKGHFGRAGLTTLEIASLRSLFRDGLNREAIVQRIIENGWPQPNQNDIGANDIAESGIEHACVVAECIIDTRGPDAIPDTEFSYTTKNQFDRYVALRLTRSGKIKQGGSLHDEWNGPQDREPGFYSPDVRYPQALDDTKIYGVAKPNRY